ncbi:hypothetical protein VTO42DRAFT_3378 [Malbranchea cinnamomea]
MASERLHDALIDCDPAPTQNGAGSPTLPKSLPGLQELPQPEGDHLRGTAGSPVPPPAPGGRPDAETPTSATQETQSSSLRLKVDSRDGAASDGEPTTQPLTQADDPLEAMDALEDAIEQIGEALPTLDENVGFDSSSRRSSVSYATKTANGSEQGDGVKSSPRAAAKSPSASPQDDRKKQTKARHPGGPRVAPRRPSSKVDNAKTDGHNLSQGASPSSTSSKTPTTRASSGSRMSLSSGKLSVHKPGFVPSKSTKPLTRPTFELPGEAISRKKRAEREERLRKEEEELKQRRAFKARAFRHSMTPTTEVRETATSRARKNNRSSQVFDDRKHMGGSSASASVAGNSSRSASVNGDYVEHTKQPVSMNKDGSRPGLPSKRTSVLAQTQGLNGARSPSTKTSLDGKKTNSATAKPTPGAQKAQGKETSQRDRVHVNGTENDRREREEMAKRARAEAAERSRQAGREWAERQRLKEKVSRLSIHGPKPEGKPQDRSDGS